MDDWLQQSYVTAVCHEAPSDARLYPAFRPDREG